MHYQKDQLRRDTYNNPHVYQDFCAKFVSSVDLTGFESDPSAYQVEMLPLHHRPTRFILCNVVIILLIR